MYIEFKMGKIGILYCNTFKKRLLGMTFKREKQDTIYCFPKCNSIHTFFMFQTIDVIMTDKDHNILYGYPNMKPNRIILPKKHVYYTYEFSHDNELYQTMMNHKKIQILTQKK